MSLNTIQSWSSNWSDDQKCKEMLLPESKERIQQVLSEVYRELVWAIRSDRMEARTWESASVATKGKSERLVNQILEETQILDRLLTPCLSFTGLFAQTPNVPLVFLIIHMVLCDPLQTRNRLIKLASTTVVFPIGANSAMPKQESLFATLLGHILSLRATIRRKDQPSNDHQNMGQFTCFQMQNLAWFVHACAINYDATSAVLMRELQLIFGAPIIQDLALQLCCTADHRPAPDEQGKHEDDITILQVTKVVKNKTSSQIPRVTLDADVRTKCCLLPPGHLSSIPCVLWSGTCEEPETQACVEQLFQEFKIDLAKTFSKNGYQYRSVLGTLFKDFVCWIDKTNSRSIGCRCHRDPLNPITIPVSCLDQVAQSIFEAAAMVCSSIPTGKATAWYLFAWPVRIDDGLRHPIYRANSLVQTFIRHSLKGDRRKTRITGALLTLSSYVAIIVSKVRTLEEFKSLPANMAWKDALLVQQNGFKNMWAELLGLKTELPDSTYFLDRLGEDTYLPNIATYFTSVTDYILRILLLAKALFTKEILLGESAFNASIPGVPAKITNARSERKSTTQPTSEFQDSLAESLSKLQIEEKQGPPGSPNRSNQETKHQERLAVDTLDFRPDSADMTYANDDNCQIVDIEQIAYSDRWDRNGNITFHLELVGLESDIRNVINDSSNLMFILGRDPTDMRGSPRVGMIIPCVRLGLPVQTRSNRRPDYNTTIIRSRLIDQKAEKDKVLLKVLVRRDHFRDFQSRHARCHILQIQAVSAKSGNSYQSFATTAMSFLQQGGRSGGFWDDEDHDLISEPFLKLLLGYVKSGEDCLKWLPDGSRNTTSIARPYGRNLYGAQQQALQACLDQRLILIIGPPGTGKTACAAACAAALTQLADKPKFVLLVAQSNLALDQLMIRTVATGTGTGAFEPNNILRVGINVCLKDAVPFTANAKAIAIRDRLRELLASLICSVLETAQDVELSNDFARCVGHPLDSLLVRFKNEQSRLTIKLERATHEHSGKLERKQSPTSEPTKVYLGMFGDKDSKVFLSFLQGCHFNKPPGEFGGSVHDTKSESVQEPQFSKANAVNILVHNMRQFRDMYKRLQVMDESTSIEEYFVSSAETRVVACTLGGLASRWRRLKSQIAAAVVEEAARCTELETLPLLAMHPKKLVLLGDDYQLPPLVIDETAKGLGYSQSLFTRFRRIGLPAILLNQQARAASWLADLYRFRYALPSNENGLLDFNPNRSWLTPRGVEATLFFVNVVAQRETGDDAESEANLTEARFVAHFARYLKSYSKVAASSITVITPYRKQKALMARELDGESIQVATVDEFQGLENEVILLSLVHKHPHRPLSSFLRDERRINVMTSRARSCLYMFGNYHNFYSSPEWRQVMDRLPFNAKGECNAFRLHNRFGQWTPVPSWQHLSALLAELKNPSLDD